MNALSDYFASDGLPDKKWHIGPEHPLLENYAIDLLEKGGASKRVLEIGYQSGGFAVPIILYFHKDDRFRYTGIDNHSYENAVSAATIEQYLSLRGAIKRYAFHEGDASVCLKKLRGSSFDLILIDHYKPLYPRELSILLGNGMLAEGGCILFHDVLGRASGIWKQCEILLGWYGLSSTIIPEIPGGLAVARQLPEERKTSARWKYSVLTPLVLLRISVVNIILPLKKFIRQVRKKLCVMRRY